MTRAHYLGEGLAAALEQEARVVPDDHPLQVGRHDGDCNHKVRMTELYCIAVAISALIIHSWF